ncbi:MAG: helix-turn-helix transcriptional regulator [Clostridia bacterium]|nr:helix-turn-helix transcriptional regulator [Clostridia bacterium]
MKKQPKTKELDLEISEIKAYIRAHGITYAKLSEMTGLSVSTITKIFGGFAKYPRVDTLRLITNALGLTKQPPPKTGQISTSSPASGVSLTEKEKRLLRAFSELVDEMQDYIIESTETLAAKQRELRGEHPAAKPAKRA